MLDADSNGQYASGYLIYHVQAALLAQKFEPESNKLDGDPFPVASSVEYDMTTWHTTFAASQNGLLVYEPGTKMPGTELQWVDRTGKNVGLISAREFFKGTGRISPDAKRMALAVGDPQGDIWVFDLIRGMRTRLTFGDATHLQPSWSCGWPAGGLHNADGRDIQWRYVDPEPTRQWRWPGRYPGPCRYWSQGAGHGSVAAMVARGKIPHVPPTKWSGRLKGVRETDNR